MYKRQVRIRSLVYAISRTYGAEADGLYGIPGPEAVAAASEDALRALGAGYRAPYLIETARAVCEGFPLESLRDLPYEEAHARLTSLKGVGEMCIRDRCLRKPKASARS